MWKVKTIKICHKKNCYWTLIFYRWKFLRSTNPKMPKSSSLLVIVLSCPLIGSLSSSTANWRAAQNNYWTLGARIQLIYGIENWFENQILLIFDHSWSSHRQYNQHFLAKLSVTVLHNWPINVVMLISTLENTNSSHAVQVCTTSFDEFCSAQKEHCKWKLFF